MNNRIRLEARRQKLGRRPGPVAPAMGGLGRSGGARRARTQNRVEKPA